MEVSILLMAHISPFLIRTSIVIFLLLPLLPSLLQSQFPEEVPLSIPAPLKAHMEDECFWILCRQKVVALAFQCYEETNEQMYFNAAVEVTKET